MMMKTTVRAAAVVAVLLGFAAAAALADECESMTKGVKVLRDEGVHGAGGRGVRQAIEKHRYSAQKRDQFRSCLGGHNAALATSMATSNSFRPVRGRLEGLNDRF